MTDWYDFFDSLSKIVKKKKGESCYLEKDNTLTPRDSIIPVLS